LNQLLGDAAGVRPPVNVVAQCDDRIITPGPNGLEQRIERQQTAVNVTDGYNTRGHGTSQLGLNDRLRRGRA
jgi:hypothetical protein